MLLDEYGSVVGMVSLENVLEELVGPIQDEFDRETPQVTPLGDGAFEVDASCPLDVLAETCGVEVPETDAETAGGLILDLLGRLARDRRHRRGGRPPPDRPPRRPDPDPARSAIDPLQARRDQARNTVTTSRSHRTDGR